ncbi:hypothetical protein TKK_0005151 [Trichogramma kaykai]
MRKMESSGLFSCSIRLKEEPSDALLSENDSEMIDEKPDLKNLQTLSFHQEYPTHTFRKCDIKLEMHLYIVLSLKPIDGLRILGIFPQTFRSHFTMNERLMRGLAARGHRVDVYSHYPLKEPMENYTDHSIRTLNITTYLNNLHYERMLEWLGIVDMSLVLSQLGNPVCELMEQPVLKKLIDDPPSDPPYDVVITQPYTASCYLAFGRRLNIPLVTVETLSSTDWTYASMGNPRNLAIVPSVYGGQASPMTFVERLKNFFMTYYVEYGYYYFVRNQNALVKKYFGEDYPPVSELMKDVDLMLINYNHMLNGIKPLTPAIVPVGGLHIAEANNKLSERTQKFLDQSESGFVYFSFGSMVRIETFPKPMLEMFYNAFRKIAPTRVLWKIVKPEELPTGLPDNVLTETWLPQMEVLKHKNIRAFITHGGLMGTMEAIYNAVPMIGFPLFSDQYMNVDLYKRKGVAIKLEWSNITRESFEFALFEVLNNPLYKKEAKKLSLSFRDVPMSPMDTAAYWIEFVARNGKKSLRSPLVDMPWWQASLLDVYAAFLVVTIVALYTVKVIVRLLIILVTKVKSYFNKTKRD